MKLFNLLLFAKPTAGNSSACMISELYSSSTPARIHALIQKPTPLYYNITNVGRSTLRYLTIQQKNHIRHITERRRKASSTKLASALWILIHADDDNFTNNSNNANANANANYAFDMAHEIILGVNETNIPLAEFAATARKRNTTSTWSQNHPLNTGDDMLHSILHRLEGPYIGEGGYTGYENAKYWLFGGDKQLESIILEEEEDEKEEKGIQKVRNLFIQHVLNKWDSFKNMGLLATEDIQYPIIAGGGRMRIVTISKGDFDFLRYYNLCELRYTSLSNTCSNNDDGNEDKTSILHEQEWREEWKDLVDELQILEIELLYKYAIGENK